MRVQPMQRNAEIGLSGHAKRRCVHHRHRVIHQVRGLHPFMDVNLGAEI
jgi:hypothetical protein